MQGNIKMLQKTLEPIRENKGVPICSQDPRYVMEASNKVSIDVLCKPFYARLESSIKSCFHSSGFTEIGLNKLKKVKMEKEEFPHCLAFDYSIQSMRTVHGERHRFCLKQVTNSG